MTARNAFMNGATLQEFFPLVAKLAQQLRLPVVFLSLDTTGTTDSGEIGLVEVATISVAASGSVASNSTLVDPELPIQPLAVKQHGLRAGDVANAPRFASAYESLSKTFSTALVVGLDASTAEVPIIYRNMVRYGLPIMSARHQLDLQDVWTGEGHKPSVLEEIAKVYAVALAAPARSAGRALAYARLLEIMLWKHGSDAVLAQLKHTQLSYLTPDMVLAPNNHLASPTANATPTKSSPQRPKLQQAGKSGQGAQAWIADLRAAVDKVIEENRVVRPTHHQEIADRMGLGWTATKVSMEIGRLLTQGKLKAEPFLVSDDQALLALHLPSIVSKLPVLKLKAVKEQLTAITGKDLEYIQIRLGLKKLGIRLEK